MFKANVGYSVDVDPKVAGKAAAEAAKAGLEDIKVAMMYCSCDYDVDAVVAGAHEALGSVPILGNTSFTGVIVPEAGFVGGDDSFVGIMCFSDPTMHVGVAGLSRDAAQTPYDAGRMIATKAKAAAGEEHGPDFFYMAASSAEEERYLKGIASVIGRVPYFGGTAADNTIEGNWKLYVNDDVFADGAVVAFFYSNAWMTNLFTGAYHETDDYGVITKLDGRRRIMEIDHVPALDKYKEWTGFTDEQCAGANLLGTSVTSPLGVKDRLGDLIAVRHPMCGNDDGSIDVGCDCAEKTCIIRLETTVDELIESVPSAMRELMAKMPGRPVAFHLVHCGGRRAGIGDRINEVADAIKEVAGDVPFICEFTFGEYGFQADGANTVGGLTLSFTGFSE